MKRDQRKSRTSSRTVWSSTWRILCSFHGTAALRPGTASTALGSGSGQLSPHKITASAERGLFDVLRACLAHLPRSKAALEPRKLRHPAQTTASASGAHAHQSSTGAAAWGSGPTTDAGSEPVSFQSSSESGGVRDVRHTRRCRATYFIPIVVAR